MEQEISNKELDLIKKLLDKAESTDSEAEAKAFGDRVQVLLIKYNLSMEQVSNHKLKEKNAVSKSRISLDDITDKRHGKWCMYLLAGVAEAYLCKVIIVRDGTENGAAVIIGRESNIMITSQMFNYLQPTIEKIEKKAWSEYEGIQKRGAYRRDFLFACQDRVTDRLIEKLKEMSQTDNNVTALIKLNDKAVSDYVKEEFPRLKSGKATRVKHRDGTYQGGVAGNNIPLNQGIGGNSNPTKHIG